MSAPAVPLRLERRRAQAVALARTSGVAADLRLFSMTFAAGFLFVSLFIA